MAWYKKNVWPLVFYSPKQRGLLAEIRFFGGNIEFACI